VSNENANLVVKKVNLKNNPSNCFVSECFCTLDWCQD